MTYLNDKTSYSFNRRAADALQAAGEAAIEEFLSISYASIAKATLKVWMKPD